MEGNETRGMYQTILRFAKDLLDSYGLTLNDLITICIREFTLVSAKFVIDCCRDAYENYKSKKGDR